MSTLPADTRPLPGLRCYPNGQVALSGALLDLQRRLDETFLGWAVREAAEEQQHPTLIPAADLERIGWFRSFPHVATFALSLEPEWDNLQRFADREPLDEQGNVRLTETSPVRDVLTPAACYHVYPSLQGRSLDGPLVVTTRNACHRRESQYTPLRRLWCFQMRELVAFGTPDEVREFLERMEPRVHELCSRLGLPADFAHATDPFFDPGHDPKYVVQALEPVKRELVYREDLALGSFNLHRSFFGQAHEIGRAGKPAWSACVAFGLERWLHAIVDVHGTDPEAWPDPREVA